MASIDELVAQQEQMMNCVQRSLINFKKLGQGKMTLAVTRQRLKLLTDNFEKCQQLDGKINALAGKDTRSSHSYFTDGKFIACENSFLEASDYMAEILERVQPTAATAMDMSASEACHRPTSHLPRMSLPNFDGSIEKWEHFRDRFDAMIAKDKTLCDVERLHYLNSCLSGNAKLAISHLSVTSSNFAVAWQILVDRFENKRQLITAHLTTLTNLTPLTSENVHELRELRDKTIAATESLKNLGRNVTEWDDFLVFLLSQKLDKATRKAWELEIGDQSDYPTFDELDQFLITRIRALDTISAIDFKSSKKLESSKLKSNKAKFSVNHALRSTNWSCPLCQGQHSIYLCNQFLSKTPKRRYEFIRKTNRCTNCFSPKHNVKECPSERSCQTCQKKHNSLLHFADKDQPQTEESSSSVSPATAISFKQNTESETSSHFNVNAISSTVNALLATARVRIYAPSGRYIVVRALIDQGSACTIISERMVQLLRIPKIHQTTYLKGVGEVCSVVKYSAQLLIAPEKSDQPAFATQALVLRSLTKYTPSHWVDLSKYSHLSGLELADRNPSSSDSIELLIGAEVFAAILKDGLRKGKLHEPIAQNTVFGWIISGPTTTTESDKPNTIPPFHIDNSLNFELSQFWEVEELQSKSMLSHEEQKCESHFTSTHSRTDTGRYIVRYPFRNGHPVNIGHSRPSALASYARLEARLSRDSIKYDLYREFMMEYIKLGHMIKIDSNAISDSQHYYIPHHPVLRDDSETSRLRVVFNASAPSSNGTSLNDLLMIGPKLQLDIVDIILRWRQFRFVFTADIEKMYRQILVNKCDQDFQRIFWRNNGSLPVDEYKLLTVTYGTASAPYQALRVIQQLVEDEGHSYPLAASVLKHQIYVDDCLFGADDEQAALQTRDQLIDLLNKGCFRLRKWASNNFHLLKDIDPSDHGLAKNLNLNPIESLKVLGLSWTPVHDSFEFHVSKFDQPGYTKRHILSTIAKFFDPLGWVSPVIITTKILMQTLWRIKSDWDAPVPLELLKQWKTFFENLKVLENISIPRWTNYSTDVSNCELHAFSDASSVAYAAVVYLKLIYVDSSCKISLLISKTKVAPIKTLSLPRLELCAILLLARLVNKVQSALQLQNLPIFCWSDSTIALAWIKQPANKWKTFVANRVTEVQTLLPHAAWRHVPTCSNPADCASRGVSAHELLKHPLWWSGPSWLTKPIDKWPEPNFDLQDLTLEKKCTSLVTSIEKPATWDLATKFSSWSKLLRVTAYIFRFVGKLRKNSINENSSSRSQFNHVRAALSPEEIEKAETFWLRQIQSNNFHSEILHLSNNKTLQKGSPLLPLNPFIDDKGLIRVAGRLRKSNLPTCIKNPIVLRSHYLLSLLIRHYHKQLLHAGPSLTLSALREKYWILRARPTVRAVLYRCVTCAREQAKTPTELMGDLPDLRVNRAPRAFTHTGIDYAGPIAVRYAPGRGSKSHKAYIAIFVCMSVKAIHLELVQDCSSESFIAAFHRFISRRGMPSSVYSDNGTCFQGASKEITIAYKSAVRNSNFQNELSTNGIKWHFIPPSAPHFGGLWEAGVRSMKHHLKRSIGLHTLTVMEMYTLLCRIEACLNSRPLAPASDNLDDYQVITPAHFLIGGSMTSLPEPSVLNLQENRLSRWQLVQKLSEEIWQHWSNDYLHTLQQRPKWRTIQRLARVGRVVLIKNASLPPSKWELGRIIECHPGDDNLVRVVTVKTANSTFKRPIVKLCFLPVDINENDHSDSAKAGGEMDSPTS